MPAREDIDPIDLGAPLLPLIYMVDVIEKPRDFRYRVVGTDIAANTLTDHTGRLLSEIADVGTQGVLTEIYGQVCETCRPSVDLIAYMTTAGNARVYENVLAPVGDDRVRILFGCAVHHWRGNPSVD